MTDETMTTKLRQAEAALLAVAEKLGRDKIAVAYFEDGGETPFYIFGKSGKSLEEAYLKVLDEEVPF